MSIQSDWREACRERRQLALPGPDRKGPSRKSSGRLRARDPAGTHPDGGHDRSAIDDAFAWDRSVAIHQTST